jgi:hypothetical protein
VPVKVTDAGTLVQVARLLGGETVDVRRMAPATVSRPERRAA